MPIGERTEDAFGTIPAFVDRGAVDRAILNVGREDVDVQGICPTDSRLSVLGASSDYVIVDVTAAPGEIQIGDSIGFSLNYAALLASMTSPHIVKQCRAT